MDKEFALDMDIKKIAKSFDDDLVAFKLKEFKLEKKLINYVTKDIVDSYNKLFAQRKECVEKFIEYYKIFLSDKEDIDILQIYKDITYKQDKEIEYWNLEIKQIKNIKSESDKFTDADYEKELRSELEKNTPFVYDDDFSKHCMCFIPDITCLYCLFLLSLLN